MKITAEPRSDQLNADDLIGRTLTVTIAGVRTGTAEQKYDIDLHEVEGRAWRPPLTILRLLLAAWGDDASDWIGRRVTLYRDETVRFGPDAVGGIRVSHMSHLPDGKPLEVRLTTKRGKRAPVRVLPLEDVQPPTEIPTLDSSLIESATTVDELRAMWSQANAVQKKRISERVEQINGEQGQGEVAGGEE